MMGRDFVNPAVFASCGRTFPVNRWWSRSQLGQSTQILDSGSQGEFVVCATESTQPQSIQFKDALEVGKRHLNLLALAA